MAVVEDVAGGTLEALLETDPTRASHALSELAAMLDVMHQQHSQHYGRVDVLERGDKASGDSCEQLLLERAIEDLAEAAERDPSIGSAAAPLHDRLEELAARVAPRTQHGLVHGELGPDHVLVDASGLRRVLPSDTRHRRTGAAQPSHHPHAHHDRAEDPPRR
nr:phosphotransferase [Streptomyces sp. CL12-4]